LHTIILVYSGPTFDKKCTQLTCTVTRSQSTTIVYIIGLRQCSRQYPRTFYGDRLPVLGLVNTRGGHRLETKHVMRPPERPYDKSATAGSYTDKCTKQEKLLTNIVHPWIRLSAKRPRANPEQGSKTRGL